MFRVKLIVAVVGGVMAYFGIQELMVSTGTKADPVDIDLAALEAGEAPANNHVRIGKHIALYAATVYAYKTSKYSKTPPTASSTVTYSFYPIISSSHPFIQALKQLEESSGGAIAEGAPAPSIDSFAVLVKTKRFKTVGSIPDSVEPRENVSGLIINRISSLDSEEKKLVKESFPKVDFDKLLILEEGRKPASALKSMGLTIGGLVLVLGGVVWMFVGRGEA